MNTALLVILLTVATLTAVAGGAGALGLVVIKLVRRLSHDGEGRGLRPKRRPAA